MAQSDGRSSGPPDAADASTRLARMHRLLDAIAECDWDDAETVMSAVLEEARAGSPVTAFGEIEDEAGSWAHLATYEELRAYFIACGRRLSTRQLGRRGRLRLAQILLTSISDDESFEG